MTDFLDSTPYFMKTYVNYLNEAALRYFYAHGIPKRTMEKRNYGHVLRTPLFFGVARDMLKLLQGMRG